MAGLDRIDLLKNAGVGNGAAAMLPVAGWYLFYAEAAWNGGNAQLQFQSPLGTWINIGTALTANGTQALQLPGGQVRVVVTTSTAVYASLLPIPTVTTR